MPWQSRWGFGGVLRFPFPRLDCFASLAKTVWVVPGLLPRNSRLVSLRGTKCRGNLGGVVAKALEDSYLSSLSIAG